MTEQRFRAFIKLQTAPALIPYKTLHGSQPNVNSLHPPLSVGGSVLHASTFNHRVVPLEGGEVNQNGSVD